MAEEKKTPAKVEESKMTKIINWFKKLPGRIAKPFKNMVAELKKVTWPSKKKWISSSVAVLVFMLFMGVVIGLLDMGASKLVSALSSLNPNNAAEETVDDAATTDDTTVTEPAEGETVQDDTAAEPTEAPAAGN